MSSYQFKGPFAEHIKNHVSLKQAIGYKYAAEAKHLLRFSVLSTFLCELFIGHLLEARQIFLHFSNKVTSPV